MEYSAAYHPFQPCVYTLKCIASPDSKNLRPLYKRTIISDNYICFNGCLLCIHTRYGFHMILLVISYCILEARRLQTYFSNWEMINMDPYFKCLMIFCFLFKNLSGNRYKKKSEKERKNRKRVIRMSTDYR